MRKIIIIALLAVSVNCHATDITIWDALSMAQKARGELLERQLQEQLRAMPLSRRR